MYTTINGKVLEVTIKEGETEPYIDVFKNNWAGKYLEIGLGSNLYDPKYGPKTKDNKIEDFSQEHRDSIEDTFLTFMESRTITTFKVIAKL